MKMFGKMTGNGLEETGDRLGGGGILESGFYTGKVKLAYAGKSQTSHAQSVTVHLDIGGREVRETFWITNKSGENFYTDKQDASKRHPLPGFTSVDDLCLLTTGLPLADANVEDKVIALYDFDARKEVPQTVPVLTGLLDQPIGVGLIRQVVDRQQKDSFGNYVATGETRDENVVGKFFHAETGRTVAEFRAGIGQAEFRDKWKVKNAGSTRNRAKGSEGRTGAPGRPASAPAANPQPRKSLFG